jgi:photosystem II stability/assembly factor-like uncharacterized protein
MTSRRLDFAALDVDSTGRAIVLTQAVRSSRGPFQLIRPGRTWFTTSDGGRTWAQRTSIPALAAVSFSSNLDGWGAAAGHSVTSSAPSAPLLHTTDGGATWQTIPDPCPRLARLPTALWFPTPNEGWVACSGERATLVMGGNALIHTSDGGVHWETLAGTDFHGLSGPFGPNPELIQMFPGGRGFGGSLFGGLETTADGGRTWRAIAPPGYVGGDGGVTGRFVDANEGFALAYDGGINTLSSTMDGGQTWQVVRRWHDGF